MRCCCDPFEFAVNSVGKRGISVVALLRLKRQFALQSRGIDGPWGDEIHAKLQQFPISVNVVTEHRIRYCPWCGADLEQWIEQNSVEFNDLARVHAAQGFPHP